MNYYELQFVFNSAVESEVISDILASELGVIGFESFVNTDEGLTAYVAESNYDKDKMIALLKDFPLEGVKIDYKESVIESKDWNEEWEKNYFKPIRIENRCIIRASFHEEEPGFDYSIIIDPKMAFGTGNHETTYLMISEILDQDLKDKEVLDMGCGTGVLAILAKMKGAGRVTAIDIDEWAFRNTLDNLKLNHTEEINVAQGGAEKIADSAPYDYIFANINRNILLQDISVYAKNLRSGGLLFMSGFYEHDIPAIQSVCDENNLIYRSHNKRNDWVAVKMQKEQ